MYVVGVVIVIVGVDLLFLRDRTWLRLAVTLGIVLVFASFFLVFVRT